MLGYMCPSCSWFGPQGAEPALTTPAWMMRCANCGVEASAWDFWHERFFYERWVINATRRGSHTLIDPQLIWRKSRRYEAARQRLLEEDG